ncbi:hypothetical protein Tco_0096918 [Tanacetum coccineum]
MWKMKQWRISFKPHLPRSTQAPPEGTTSGGAEDLDKLTKRMLARCDPLIKLARAAAKAASSLFSYSFCVVLMKADIPPSSLLFLR